MTHCSNATIYRRAAVDVQQGWLQDSFASADGSDKCLVQAVLNAANIRSMALPKTMTVQLDRELCTRPEYLKIKRSDIEDKTLQGAIIAWNDQDGRTKEEVVTLLNELADHLDTEEREELMAENDRLKQQIAALKRKVGELKSENSWLRRMMNSLALRDNVRQLDALDAELGDLQEEPEYATTKEPARIG